MTDFTTVAIAIFPTSNENSHFPVSKQMVKVQLSLDMLEKITCFTRGEQAIDNCSLPPLIKKIAIFMWYVRMVETWIHHYAPESNRQSAEWTTKGENGPKRPKTQISAIGLCQY